MTKESSSSSSMSRPRSSRTALKSTSAGSVSGSISKTISGASTKDIVAVADLKKSRESLIMNQRYSSNSVRRKYTELIKKCQDLEGREGFDGKLQEDMNKNIKAAHQLFLHMTHENEKDTALTPKSSGTRSYNRYTGGGAGELYMAFMHTKMCSSMIKYKSESIGSSTSKFKVDDFLNAIKRKCLDEAEDYSAEEAVKSISKEAAAATKTLPFLSVVVGSFDFSAIAVPKEKRPKINRKQNPDTSGVEQDEPRFQEKEMGVATEPEKVAKELNKLLWHYSKTQNKPAHLYEFVLDPRSFNKSIECIFYVAFLVHDGYAALSREADTRLKDLALVLKPEKPVEEPLQKQQKQGSRKNFRNKFILSFSPILFKKLSSISTGDSVIPDLGRFKNA